MRNSFNKKEIKYSLSILASVFELFSAVSEEANQHSIVSGTIQNDDPRKESEKDQKSGVSIKRESRECQKSMK